MNEETKKCKHCQTDIPKKAKVCPNCRKKQSGKLKWIIVAVILIGIISSTAGGGDSTEATQKSDSTKTEDSNTSNENTSDDTKQIDAEESENKEPDIPMEFKSALIQAESYSDIMHMSKQGIYDQLVSEYGGQFSEEAAQYAIDNLQADYKANALEQAKQYQETMAMSPEAIRDQLTSEYGGQFTQEEADYAVENLPQ